MKYDHGLQQQFALTLCENVTVVSLFFTQSSSQPHLQQTTFVWSLQMNHETETARFSDKIKKLNLLYL